MRAQDKLRDRKTFPNDESIGSLMGSSIDFGGGVEGRWRVSRRARDARPYGGYAATLRRAFNGISAIVTSRLMSKSFK